MAAGAQREPGKGVSCKTTAEGKKSTVRPKNERMNGACGYALGWPCCLQAEVPGPWSWPDSPTPAGQAHSYSRGGTPGAPTSLVVPLVPPCLGHLGCATSRQVLESSPARLEETKGHSRQARPYPTMETRLTQRPSPTGDLCLGPCLPRSGGMVGASISPIPPRCRSVFSSHEFCHVAGSGPQRLQQSVKGQRTETSLVLVPVSHHSPPATEPQSLPDVSQPRPNPTEDP